MIQGVFYLNYFMPFRHVMSLDLLIDFARYQIVQAMDFDFQASDGQVDQGELASIRQIHLGDR